MKINASEEEIEVMAKLAILASIPVGMGIIHHMPFLKFEDLSNVVVTPYPEREILSVDYYQGRMVKFHARKNKNEGWEVNPNELNIEYQSWSKTFPTWNELLDSARSYISKQK